MTEVRDHSRQCAGKVRYSTKREAKRAIRRAAAVFSGPLRTVNAYRCPHCRCFHIGHRPQRHEAA